MILILTLQDSASAICLSPYRELTTPQLNIVTNNNLLLKISLENAMIKQYFYLRPVRGKVIDLLEDETRKFYVATDNELFIFQEDAKNQLRFIDYIYDGKKEPKTNKKGKILTKSCF